MQGYHASILENFHRESKLLAEQKVSLHERLLRVEAHPLSSLLTEEKERLLKRLSSLEAKKENLLKVRVQFSKKYCEEMLFAKRATLDDFSSRLDKLTGERGWTEFHLSFWRFFPMRDLVFSRLLLLGQHPAKGRVGGTLQNWLDGKPKLRVAAPRAKSVPLVDQCLGKTSKDMREQRNNVMVSVLCSISFENCLLLIANIKCKLVRKILLSHVLQATWQIDKIAWVRLLGPWKLDVSLSVPPTPDITFPAPYEKDCHTLKYRRYLGLVLFDKETLRRILDPKTNEFGVFMSCGRILPNLVGNVRKLLLVSVQQYLTLSRVHFDEEIGIITTQSVKRCRLQHTSLCKWLMEVANPTKVRKNGSSKAYQNAMCSLVDTEARIVTMLRLTHWLSEFTLQDAQVFYASILLSCVPRTPRNTEELQKLGTRAYYRMIDNGIAVSCGREFLSLVHGGHVLYMKSSIPFVIRKMILSFIFPAYTNSYDATTSFSDRSSRTILLLEMIWKNYPSDRNVEFVKI